MELNATTATHPMIISPAEHPSLWNFSPRKLGTTASSSSKTNHPTSQWCSVIDVDMNLSPETCLRFVELAPVSDVAPCSQSTRRSLFSRLAVISFQWPATLCSNGCFRIVPSNLLVTAASTSTLSVRLMIHLCLQQQNASTSRSLACVARTDRCVRGRGGLGVCGQNCCSNGFRRHRRRGCGWYVCTVNGCAVAAGHAADELAC